ncbi:hypothetical protein QE152_g34336 [Popillia japonica]|uniref:Uncharacterized protein n=1 Tax=Popillia japonica TaxID=7064 RepID=A0AAW1IU20_POPJA
METNNTPYSALLYNAIVEKHPQIGSKTVQNVLDQRRYLFTQNRLPPELVQTIRDEVAIQLGLKKTIHQGEDEQHINQEPPPVNAEVDREIAHIFQSNYIRFGGTNQEPPPVNAEVDREIAHIFQSNYIRFGGTDPTRSLHQ